MNVRLLLVDDHPMLRQGLRQVIAQHPNLMLVGEAATGALALELARKLNPDLVVMDTHLPDMNGIEATRKVLSAVPATKVVVFSGDAARSMVDEALQAGACGYILKMSAGEELIQAIDIVMAGKLYLSSEISAGILQDYRKRLVAESKPLLSDREKQLLWLIAEGWRNKDIAFQLAINIKSVEAYRSRLMKKLDCPSSAKLVRYAIREGIVAP
jgi:DNA-binding NarL/FixJ family response regulator